MLSGLSGANESATRGVEDLSSDQCGRPGRELEPGPVLQKVLHFTMNSARDTIVLYLVTTPIRYSG